jgi:hypothetical protein
VIGAGRRVIYFAVFVTNRRFDPTLGNEWL